MKPVWTAREDRAVRKEFAKRQDGRGVNVVNDVVILSVYKEG